MERDSWSASRPGAVPVQPAVPATAARRIAALADTGLLDSPIEEAFDRLTRLAAHATRAPISLVSLVDEHRQFFKSAFGIPEPWLTQRETPLTHSFCKYVVATGEPLLVEDSRLHPLVRENPAIRDLDVIAYAGMPLRLRNGEYIGTLCVVDHRPRGWTAIEIEALRELSLSVVAEVDLRVLMNARQELLELVCHDLKNPLTTVGMAAQMLNRQAVPPAARVLSTRVLTSVDQMNSIVSNLVDIGRIETGTFTLNRAPLACRDLVTHAIRLNEPSAMVKGLELVLEGDAGFTIHADSARAVQLLSSVLAAFVAVPEARGRIQVIAERRGSIAGITVLAEHAPLELAEMAHFFDRMWRSKALPTKGLKLGLSLARDLVLAHDGRIWCEYGPGDQRSVRIMLPGASASATPAVDDGGDGRGLRPPARAADASPRTSRRSTKA